MNTIRGELIRLFSTRLPLWTLLAAVCGGGITGLLALIGPENSTTPMPGIDTADGAGLVVGLGALLLFAPALIGTVAITSEYRHRTIGTTFLSVPRRGRVLGAKLVVYALLGLVYGVVASATSGLTLIGAAALRDVTLGLTGEQLIVTLGQLAVASAVYMVLGVGIGALARHQLLAIGIVLGYFYFLEHVLMLIPGVNAVYPFLPGGATASLTRLTFLTDAVAEQTDLGGASVASPLIGAAILVAYALLAAAIAVVAPLRRDLR